MHNAILYVELFTSLPYSKRNERSNYECINKLNIFELTIIYFRCKVIGIRASISKVTAVVWIHSRISFVKVKAYAWKYRIV